MSHTNNLYQEQDQNTAKLVMNTFYKIADREGITAGDITKYLREKFGDVWRTAVLMNKAEDTLKQSAELGFLDRDGDRYMAHLAREMKCGRRRKRCGCRRRRRRRRSRRSRCRRRRRSRKRRCGCK